MPYSPGSERNYQAGENVDIKLYAGSIPTPAAVLDQTGNPA